MNFFTHLPYRNNVSCIIFKKDKFLLVQLTDWLDTLWKFPQGGVEKDETETQAVKRELFEELGSKKFKIVGKSKFTNQYDWIEKVIVNMVVNGEVNSNTSLLLNIKEKKMNPFQNSISVYLTN